MNERRQIRPLGVLILTFFAIMMIAILSVGIFIAMHLVSDDEPSNDINQSMNNTVNDDKGQLSNNTPDTQDPTTNDDPGTPSTPDLPITPVVPDEPEEKDIKITFAAFGDNIIHSSIYDDAQKVATAAGVDGLLFDQMYENIKDYSLNADIAYINQETPICGDELGWSGYPNFNTPEAVGDTIMDLGFDIVNIANNHMLDKRGQGLVNTINYWNQKGVTLLGGHLTREDYDNIRLVEEQGIKIAFLSYTYGTNGMTAGNGYSDLYIPLIDNDDIARQIGEAKKIADLVFVSVHWGIENSFEPSYEQRATAQTIVDAGADVILGNHPHVLQEVKWKERSDGGKTLIFYSLGNMISTMEYPINMVGSFATFDIEKKAGSDTIEITNVKVIPTMTHYNMSRRGLKIYIFEEYNQELYETHGTTLKDGRYSYEKLKTLITDTINSDFLSDFYKQ